MVNEKKIISFIAAISLSFSVIAQSDNTATNTNGELMKTGGHIYVVLAIVLTILAGFIIYVIRLDRKITKLEKNEL